MGEFFKMTPHEIYQYFATGRGTDLLDDAQDATRKEWELEDHRAHLIRKQGELIRGGWQGTASEGAFGAAQPLAESALRGTDHLSRAEDLLDRQSGSFHRAANSVKPVPAGPPEMDIMDIGLPFTDYEQQVTSYQADAQHNIDVYGIYDGASEYNEKNMPAEYATVNHAGGDISVTAGDTPPGDTGDHIIVDDPHPRDGGQSGPPDERRYPGATPVDAGEPPVGEPTPGSLPRQQTSPSDFVPPRIDTPGYAPPAAHQPTPTSPSPGGLIPSLPVGGPGGRTGGPGVRGGTYSPGTGGSPGSGSGPGTGGGRGTGGGPGVRGNVPGAGPRVGALAAEEAAAQRAASAAGRGSGSGMMGGAPVGAGRGKGDDDDEHKRKVLIEADAEGVFGSDILTAPQVIGDDEYEDD